LLSDLAKNNSRIIPLSFHVDYWNRLGWTDPFSSSEYSDWQTQYATHFQLESIYTPQLVVNGEYELVGSNRNKAESAIQKALTEHASITVQIKEVTTAKEKVKCRVELTGDVKKQELVVVLLQKTAVVKVRAGENEGATLSHINIVRYLSRQAAKESNEIELDLPVGLTDKNWKIAAYTRQRNDLKVTGATLYE
ncbi:MAG TPA: DUF1223 domain-containing protein, partial [Chitinophagaceae bacterium]|nr:DUF1223 domain-containing protein [Chitinophagaceae bacterium]